MTDSKVELANQLKRKIGQLLDSYRELKRLNESLKSENESLAAELEDARNEYARLDAAFNAYRLSQSLVADGSNSDYAKKRISQIVREIDRCIALLNR